MEILEGVTVVETVLFYSVKYYACQIKRAPHLAVTLHEKGIYSKSIEKNQVQMQSNCKT